MPEASTVPVVLTRAEAEETALWLLNRYRPSKQRFPDADDKLAQRKTAWSLGKQLEKAAKRKRSTDKITLRVERAAARWFGAFMKPDGWWDFDGELIPAQPSPRRIQKVALSFHRASLSRRGRHSPKLEKLLSQRDRLVKSNYDERNFRRKKRKIEDLETARKHSDPSTDTLDFKKISP